MAQASRRRQSKGAMPPERTDPPVAHGASLTVMSALRAYRDEAKRAREPRLRLNKRNWDAFMGLQDWSHKQKGQSTEFLPKVAMAKEQIGAWIERGLTDFGDWFDVKLLNQSVMDDAQARKLMQYQLDHAATNGVNIDEDFPAIIADAVAAGLLGSLMILKVHGRTTTSDQFKAERGVSYMTFPGGVVVPRITSDLVRRQVQAWQLVIDLIPPEDYLPDPTGRGLYEMHEVERDLWEVQEMADQGVYDPDIVRLIAEDYARTDEQSYSTREIDREQRGQSAPSFRKRVVLLECWGSLLTPEGRMAEQNIVCTMANNKYLIRPPEANPFWHGERPFVTRPLLRVPFSVWHKALFDHATDLNLALNELYNLMFDGGMSSVWGVKQLYAEHLDDPRQVKDGISQGMTLVVKEGTPPGTKILEQVAGGQVPGEAMAMFQLLDQEFQTSTQVNAVRLGQQPRGGDTTATAIVEAQQQSNTFFDGMIRDAEKMITKVLQLGWCNTMQFLEDADAEEVIAAVGERSALALAQMSPAERYSLFAGCQFQVHGLSALLARLRDFQKMMTLMQAIGGNPLLLQAFIQRFSPQKILSHLFKSLNMDPSSLEPDDQEKAQQPQALQQLMALMGRGPGQPGQRTAPPMPTGAPGPLPLERMPADQPGGY